MTRFFKLLEPASKYLIAAVLIIVPLFPKFPLFRVPGTYVAIRFEDLLLLALAVLTFIKIVPDLKNFLKDEIVQAFLIFFAAGFLSLIAGSFLTQTVDFRLGILHWARRIEYVVPFFAGLTLLAKEKVSQNLNFYIKILLIVVVIAFIYGIGQRYFSFPVIITQNEEYAKGIALLWTPGSHINSTFAGHYDLASFIVLVMPIFLSLLFILKDKISRLSLILASGMGLWLLIVSLSRIGQIAYIFAVGISFFLIRKFKAFIVILIISLFFAGMSGSLDARFLRIFDVIYQKTGINKVLSRAESNFLVNAQEFTLPASYPGAYVPTPTPIPVFEDRSTSIRLNVEWPRAIRAFFKDPIIGTGYSSIDLATDNDFLRMLGETGILGFFAFWLIFLRIGKLFVREALPVTTKLHGIELGFISGVMGAVLGTFLIAFFIDIFEASKFATIFWLILGYGVYFLRNKQYA